MKNPVIKKLLAYLLVGAMVISTPITAAAAEHSVIADAYSIGESDNNSGDDNSGDDNSGDDNSGDDNSGDDNSGDDNSGDDNSDDMGKLDENYVLDITGLALDRTELTLDVDEYTYDRIQARVLFKDYDPTDEEMVLADQAERAIINKNLRWIVEPQDTVVSVAYDYKNTNNEVDKSVCTVTAVDGGVAKVTAYLDVDGDGVLDDDEFSATATVTVKSYIKELTAENFSLPEKLYVKHTYDLNKFFQFPATAKGERITFYVKDDSGKNYAKQATITADGILTIKKKVDNEISIIAVSEHGVQSPEAKATVDEGNPAKKVTVNPSSPIKLDYGTQETEKKVKATLEGKNGSGCTDAITWTSKNPKIATVAIDETDGKLYDIKADGTRVYDYTQTYNATITAAGIGSTTITGTASSGKKVNIKVTVDSTPAHIRIAYAGNAWDKAVNEPISIYTGKQPQLSIVPYDADYNEIPTNAKTKYKWTIDSSQDFKDAKGKDLKSKVSSKGRLTPAIMVAADKDYGTVTVKAEINKTSTNNTITFNVKQMIVTPNVDLFKEDGEKITYPINKKNLPKVCVGTPAQYTAAVKAVDKNGEPISAAEALEGLDWAASGAGTASDTGLITATKGGKITLKLGYVANVKNKLKFVTQNYTIESQQKATSLVFAKDVIAVEKGSKAAEKVTISIKQQLPKGSKDGITWKYIAGQYNEETKETVVIDSDTASTGKVKIDAKSKQADKKKNTKGIFNVKECPAGTVVKVGAYTDGGVVGYAYIYVIDSKPGKPSLSSEVVKNKMTVPLGTGKKINAETSPALVRKNVGYINEPVTFSVDKKGVNIVSVSANGTVYGLAPGKAKVTVTSASGKKATVTVTVE